MSWAPMMMKIARSTRAIMMPTMRISCWYFLGTMNCPMMMRKTNRLSMLRLYSVSHPATNCPASSALPSHTRSPAKHRARRT